MYKDTTTPQVLLLGDACTKGVKLPNSVTYCFSSGKTGDFTRLIPKLLNHHPSVETVIIHTGSFDLMDRQSARLHEDFEELCVTIESLGKQCILSGPIPSPLRSNEHFSRLFGLHHWLSHFCVAAGYNFVPNFDSFWANHYLFNSDGLHLSAGGAKQLTSNLMEFLSDI